jgi:hypothetical protein
LDEPKATTNLSQIASEVRNADAEPNTTNLTHIASEIREPEQPQQTTSLTQIASEAKQADDATTASDTNPNTSNLINITGDLLKVASKLNNFKDEDEDDDDEITTTQQKHSSSDPISTLNIAIGLMNMANKDDDHSMPSNLVNIASDIRGQASTSNLKNIASEVRDNDRQQPEEIASYIKYRNSLRSLLEKNGVSDHDKLNVINVLTNTLVDLHIKPHFPIAWLLMYSNALHKLNADASTKVAFNRWLWASIGDLKNSPQELSKIPPPVIIQLAHDVKNNNEIDRRKVRFFCF